MREAVALPTLVLLLSQVYNVPLPCFLRCGCPRKLKTEEQSHSEKVEEDQEPRQLPSPRFKLRGRLTFTPPIPLIGTRNTSEHPHFSPSPLYLKTIGQNV
ncbi:hypothetical protein TNCV_2602011 [Trichonephila clavipes]|nr:hypothetical protein TNCV_2602011 [Trichonephila clavipes]